MCQRWSLISTSVYHRSSLSRNRIYVIAFQNLVSQQQQQQFFCQGQFSIPKQILSLPVPVSSLGADPAICLPSHPNCPPLHLLRTDPSQACQLQAWPSLLLQVTVQIHPPRGSCCLQRRAEVRNLRQKSRPAAAGEGISDKGWGSPRLWSYWASTGPGRSPPGSAGARLEMTWGPGLANPGFEGQIMVTG